MENYTYLHYFWIENQLWELDQWTGDNLLPKKNLNSLETLNMKRDRQVLIHDIFQ